MVPALFHCQKHRLLLAGPAEARGWFTRGLLRRRNRRDLLFNTAAAGQELWAKERWPDGWATHKHPERKHIQMDVTSWTAQGRGAERGTQDGHGRNWSASCRVTGSSQLHSPYRIVPH